MLRIVLLALSLCFVSFGVGRACTTPAGAKALESEMIGWINQQRSANGLSVLARSGKLTSAAMGHACDMAERGYFSHQRSGGPDLKKRLKAQGYGFRRAAENIAKTRSSAIDTATSLWRNSSEHWANVLEPTVTEVGVGIAAGGDGRTYWVMNVGRTR